MSLQNYFTNKKEIVIGGSFMLGILMTLFFQNCSNNSKISSMYQQSQVDQLLHASSTDLSGVGLLYDSGPVADPNYIFQVKYNVDFRNKSLQIISSKGALVGSSIPDSTQKSITAGQVSQLITLMTAMKHKPCPTSVATSGGRINLINILRSEPKVLDVTVFGTECVELQYYQKGTLADGGYEALATYIKSL